MATSNTSTSTAFFGTPQQILESEEEAAHEAARQLAHRVVELPEFQETAKWLHEGLTPGGWIEVTLPFDQFGCDMRRALKMALETAVEEFRPSYVLWCEDDDDAEYVMIVNLDSSVVS